MPTLASAFARASRPMLMSNLLCKRPVRWMAGASRGATRLTDPADLLDSTDVFLFDCDGVIWKGDSVIPGVPEVLATLRAMGKKCFFVTNNSTKSRRGFKKKFDSLGLQVEAEEILSSSFAAAAYFEQTKFNETGKKVYVIGESGIGEELDLVGVPWIGGEAFKGIDPDVPPTGKVEIDPDVGAVVVGFDRWINYYKIQYAQLCLNQTLPDGSSSSCEFIATNRDSLVHLTSSQEWAGNNAMVSAIAGCTSREPTVVGKPSPLLVDYLNFKYGLDTSRVCMVGDRLDTDILFGNNNGMKSCLVLSGVTTEEKLLSDANQIIPDFFCGDITAFLK